MKRIALLSVPDPRNPLDENNRVDYRNLVETAIRIPLDRQQGATMDEMRKSVRVLDALDRAIGYAPLELEDADWEFLKLKVEHMPWAQVDRRYIQFYDDIHDATDAPRVPAMADGVAGA